MSLRSWVQPYRCFTQTHLCCGEFIRGGFVFLPRGGQIDPLLFILGDLGEGVGVRDSIVLGKGEGLGLAVDGTD